MGMPTCVTELYAGFKLHEVIAMDDWEAVEQDKEEDQVDDKEKQKKKKKLLAWLRMLIGACTRML